MLQEHHHMSQNGMQRNVRMSMQQMGPPPNHRTQPMLMSLQPTVPASHTALRFTGVLVSIPPGPALISTPSIPQPPKTNVPQVYHYENPSTTLAPEQAEQQSQQQSSQQQQQPNQQSQQQQSQQHHQHQQHQHQQHHQQHHQQQQQTQTTDQTQNPNTSTSSITPTNSTLANIKEKTPMCLVNELARYNKIQHQYQLTEESGPAHKKTFTVTLKLGNEEYVSEGPSIKKAQHSAAAMSLTKTEFKHPPAKNNKNRPGSRANNPGVMTPTVELNALAMKRGERPVYILDVAPSHQVGYINQTGFYPRQNIYGTQNQPRYTYDTRRNVRPHYPYHDNRYYGQYRPNAPAGEPYTVRLRVGDREYPGVGCTVQAARHDAAAKAIEEIKNLGDNEQGNNENGPKTINIPDLNTEFKSPISLVHEIALKRNLNVTFDVLSEKGPPHMKIFITQCRVGNFIVEAEGNGKKISKKRAAEKMLEELSKLPPLPTINNLSHLKRKRVTNKKKTRNLIKVNMDKTNDYPEEINPISRLIQIQQANKEREPIYTVLEERGAPRRREFVIEASVNGHSCTGVGPNKKVAKRNAAEALLIALGYTNPIQNQTPKPVLKNDKDIEQNTNSSSINNNNNNNNNNTTLNVTTTDKQRKVTFVEEKIEQPSAPTTIGGSGGRQLVPGILLVGDQNTNFQQNKSKDSSNINNVTICETNKKSTGQQTQSIKSSSSQPIQGVRSKDKLLYLAQYMNIQVQFSDFPKANHEMYLTLVSLSTNPPQVCHGEGPTTEASHEKASLEALKVLSELGLDIGSSNNNNNNNSAKECSSTENGAGAQANGSKTNNNNNNNNIQNGVNK